MKKIFALIVATGMALCAIGASYYYEGDNKVYVCSVPLGESHWLTDAAVKVLAQNNVTNFVKRGGGYLNVTNDLGSYTGYVTIEEGVYKTRPLTKENTTLGKSSTGGVEVMDGATLSYDSDVNNGCYLNRVVTFAGKGVKENGVYLGALNVSGGHRTFGNTLGYRMVLSGDAMIFVNRLEDSYVGVPGNSGRLDMNGYTLTYKSPIEATSSTAYVYVNNDSESSLLKKAGNVIVQGRGIDLSGSLNWLSGGGELGGRDLIVDTNSILTVNGPGGVCKHRLVMRPGAIINLLDGTSYGSGNRFTGPILFDDPENRTVLRGEGRVMNIEGVASGNGLFISTNCCAYFNNVSLDPKVTRKSDVCSNFTNGIVAVEGARVFLRWGSAIGTVCKFIELNNAHLLFQNNLTYLLPNVIVNGRCDLLGLMDYDYASASGAPTVEDCQHYLELTLGKDCQAGFATNAIADVLYGQGDLTLETVEARHPYYPVGGRQLHALKITNKWVIDPEQAVNGVAVKVMGKVDFNETATIDVDGEAIPKTANASFIVMRASDGINGLDGRVFLSSDRKWRITKGDDGKTMVMTAIPIGGTLIVY